MDTNQENSQTTDLGELVNKVSDALRPFLTDIVKAVLAGEEPKANEPSAEIQGEQPKIAEETLGKLSVELTKIDENIKEILGQVQDFTYKDKINKELHEELQKHQSGLRSEFITPLLKTIIREYDRATQQYEFYLKKNEEEPQGELFSKVLKEFNIMSLSLLDILENYNLTPFEAQENGDFSASEYKILKVIETTDLEKNGKIAKTILCGFRDIESGRLIRQAEVNIYKYTKDSEN